VPFGKCSSILRGTSDSAQSGQFCAKVCVHRILTSLVMLTAFVVMSTLLQFNPLTGTGNYTMSHKKRATRYSFITVRNVGRF